MQAKAQERHARLSTRGHFTSVPSTYQAFLYAICFYHILSIWTMEANRYFSFRKARAILCLSRGGKTGKKRGVRHEKAVRAMQATLCELFSSGRPLNYFNTVRGILPSAQKDPPFSFAAARRSDRIPFLLSPVSSFARFFFRPFLLSVSSFRFFFPFFFPYSFLAVGRIIVYTFF